MNRLKFSNQLKNTIQAEFNPLSIYRLGTQSGMEVNCTDGNVAIAYANLKRLTNEAKIRELEKRFVRHTKPKHVRQQKLAALLKEKRNSKFKEKVSIALEMMENEATTMQ